MLGHRRANQADGTRRGWLAKLSLSMICMREQTSDGPLSSFLGIWMRIHCPSFWENYVKADHCLWAPLLVLIALAATGDASAQSNVESRVEKLEETVRVLERRVAALEEQLRPRSTSANVASDKVNWRKLQRGMLEDDVEKLLGSPTRVDAFGPFTVWHYGSSGGQVRFDGRSRTVNAWSEP